jgi:uncharacterized protein
MQLGRIRISMDSEKNCVLLFVRAPEKGMVKTRLARVLGEEAALEHYKDFVEKEMETLSEGNFDTAVCYCPPESKAVVEKWLGVDRKLIPQSGKDLGERMADAFSNAFSMGYRKVLLIGSDLPDLPLAIICEAFEELDRADAVVGPALDGGYYLIGFCRGSYSKNAFRDIPWGESSVFGKTLLRFGEESLRYHELPPWRDIDDYGDLLWYLEKTGAQNLIEHTNGMY